MALRLNKHTPIFQTEKEMPVNERTSRSRREQRSERRTNLLHDSTTKTAKSICFQNPLGNRFEFPLVDMKIF